MQTAQEEFAKAHPFLPESWGPSVPDKNPGDEAVARLRVRAQTKGAPDELLGRVLELELQTKKLNSQGGHSSSGGGAIVHPFQISRVDDDTFFVRFGTLQDVAPTNVATPLDLDVSSNVTFTVYLDLEIDLNGVLVGVTLSSASTGKPADSDYHGYITLGTVVVSGLAITTINQAATHSLRYAMCGRVVEDDALTTAGTFEFWGF